MVDWLKWYRSVALCLVFAISPVAALAQSPQDVPSVGFYYGDGAVPVGFKDFDWLVVNPGPQRLPSALPGERTVFAYVSLGETVPGDSLYSHLPSECSLGTNPNWGGKIIDLASSQCRHALIQDVVAPIWNQGYHNFFLDTLDSYEQIAKTPAARQAQRDGLVALVEAIKAAHPDAKLIANRGFSALAQLHQDLVAVAAESLFHEWNPASKTYMPVADGEQSALIAELKSVQSRYHLPVIAMDYLPPDMNRAGWWADAQRIRRMGFIPYVSDASLTGVGASLREPMPRHVLVFYNSSDPEQFSSAFANGAMPLEYLGYIPQFQRLAEPLPPLPHAGEYAGVVFWGDGAPVQDVASLSRWLSAAKAQGIPILLLGDFSGMLSPALASDLSLQVPDGSTVRAVTVQSHSAQMDYELPVRPDPRDFASFAAPTGSQVWLRLQDNQGQTEDAAAITPWGGYVHAPYLLTTLPNKDTRWLVDPFALFREGLRLPDMPVPDTTTESGRRLYMAQTDGDGFVSRAQFPPYHIAGEVYMHRILEKYRLPFTGSIIVGDLLPGDRGLYPALAPLGTQVARQLFQLPYVEIGSHMWSHPFNWPAIEAGKDYPGINLPVPGYHFSPYMEAVGAAKWIDEHLAPPGKHTVIDQWSGDCEPDAQVVGLAYGAGLMNINGGETTISKKDPSITAVPPIGIFRGQWLQVFAPDANEDWYTNQWHGPYWGYENVIQTFEMSDKPHRLKPIDMYTHWYSATKLASLSALEKVYDWVLTQSITPIYVADYGHIANNFFTIRIARQGDGFWFGDVGALRELRMPKTLGVPNIAASHGIAGYDESPNGRLYVHMGAPGSVTLSLAPGSGTTAYIESANAPITAFHRVGRGFSAHLQGYVPITAQLGHSQGCQASVNGQALQLSGTGQIRLAAQDAVLNVHCP